MSEVFLVVLLLSAIFLGVIIFVSLGRRLAARRRGDANPVDRGALSTIEGSVYALLGLMVAFTYAEATGRFETRRSQTVDEANAIGTAYLRLDLLPAAAQPALRERFRRYTQARIDVYRSLPDIGASELQAARAARLQNEIWRDSLIGLRGEPTSSSVLLVNALNEMFDITTTREIYLRTHTPPVITGALVVLSLICALLLGYGLPQERSTAVTVHTLSFALVLTVVLYVIFDLDHPRAGLIRLDYTDHAMQQVLDGMGGRGETTAP